MKSFFPEIKKPIRYEGPDSKNPLAFKHYNPKQKVLGKTMAEHLRFSVCYWHTFKGLGTDMFGDPTIQRLYAEGDDEMKVAEQTMYAAFEFFTKLGVRFWWTKEIQFIHESFILGSAEEDRGTAAMLRKHQRPAGLANLGYEGCHVRAERSQRLNILGRFHAGHVGHLSVR